jgi:hypothetical protein
VTFEHVNPSPLTPFSQWGTVLHAYLRWLKYIPHACIIWNLINVVAFAIVLAQLLPRDPNRMGDIEKDWGYVFYWAYNSYNRLIISFAMVLLGGG